MEPDAFKEMQVRMGGTYSGIGIYIGIKDNQLIVIAPIESTPAFDAGLRSHDKIITIDGKTTKDMALEEAVSMIRGQRGTKVKLGVLRQDWKDPKDFDIVRAQITIKSVKAHMIGKTIGYIKINTFENVATAQEFEKALREMKSAEGLVIDVRNNGGGLLQAAIDIGSMFIEQGMIVQTVDREGRTEQIPSTGRVLWRKPVVVLINEASASASEILAGAMRDNRAGTLVGKTTFGKASVQNVRRLNDGSAVLVTIAKYLTPNGENISKKGLSPEVESIITTAEAEAMLDTLGDDPEKDPQLKKGIEVLKSMLEAKRG
jgi:carboxyl-terminal processing protease